MNTTLRATTLALAALLLLASAPVRAQTEPIPVTADATFPTVSQGGFQDVDCRIDNLSGERILAHITVFVTYADGSVQSFRLAQPPTVLGPGESFILSIGFAVPQDAALGTATFTCEVRALGAAGGGFTASDTATFEVVAA